ncbi:MAG: protease inhibitor I42 family protein [Akkermansia sp.]|nr:protease inhibitor I42 family protein [Akkermansia sp.]
MKSLFAFLAAAVCAVAQETAEMPAVPVALHVGETASVILAGNPTTGYSWTLAEPVKAGGPVFVSLALVDDEPLCKEDEENPCCGKPRPTEVRMTGVHAGVMSFTVQYSRIWETNVPPLKTQTFVVTVQP